MSSFSAAVFAPVAVAIALIATAGPGCSTSCDNAVDGEPERVTSGTTDPTGSVYESSSWGGEYLEFLPQKELQFVHGLRGTPRLVQIYVGFVKQPLGVSGKGNVAEVAGNLAIYEGVNAEFVEIRNDTCETLFVRLVASHPIEDTSGGAAAGAPSL